MSRKYFLILSVITTGVLVWLIVVQSKWITNAIQVESQHFDQLVNTALAHVVEKVEEQEMVMHITNEMVSISSDTNKIRVDKVYLEQKSWLDSLSSTDQKRFPDNELLTNVNDSVFYQIHEYSNLDSSFKLVDTKNRQLKAKDLQEHLLNKITNKTVFVENIVNKLIRKKINIEDRISKKALTDIMANTFENKGINFSYEFAVRKNQNEYFVQTENFCENFNGKYYETTLFPNDLLSAPNYLVVYFPDYKRNIMQSLPKLVGTSVMLTIVIMLFFTITLYIILRQKKLSEIKNDFINNMTHELKTPISTISLASQMLKDNSIPKQPERLNSISQIIDDESKRLSFQVEKVLQMAIIDKGGLNLKMQELDINELLRSIAASFELKIHNNNGQIDTNLTDTKIYFEADEVHFSNVIYNLIDNGIKYSADHLHISVSTETCGKKFVVKIKDRGIGIKKENQKRIFEKFYRVPTGNVHDVKGFGLGLSYVKKIVEAHKGSIKVKSELKKGTEFILEFPLEIKK